MTHFIVRSRESIQLANGPSKFDLMTALFVWKPSRHTVSFVDASGTELAAVIDSCQAEDGSGESWNITGRLDLKRPGGKIRIQGDRFRGYFSTASRKGWLEMIPDAVATA